MSAWPNINSACFILPAHVDETIIKDLKNHITAGKIPLEFVFQENGQQVRFMSKERVSLDNNALENIEKHGIEIKLNL